ncbi:MAG TPA: tRNA dihydrouridine synthase DusB, partial [Sutterellaceae bacterium]|nr:tRNA dihydrouridine synthase DusB [Sutterellaceae bacterium]
MSGATVQVGNVEIPGRVFLAPLAGFTDLPFRQICRKLGAAYAVAEMVASQKHLRESRKSQERFSLGSESYPRAIQLLGSDPVDLADTARYAVQCGAQIVDFNCGCPAKKVCSVECGSALLKDEALVEKLLKALTEAVDVPVTLKYRLGWDAEHINALNIAAIAQEAGIKMLVLHGRTREQGFKGEVDY